MKVYDGIESIPNHKFSCLTVGMFDGIHRGHIHLLRTLVHLAREKEATSQVLTFRRHPTAILFPNKAPAFVRPLEYKLEAMEKVGVDEVCLIDFSVEFSNITHQEFIQHLLMQNNKLLLVLGYNFRFGKANKGGLDYIQAVSAEAPNRLDLVVIDPVIYDGETVSSSKIRGLLNKGLVKHANALLGDPYFIDGKVIEGSKRGRQIGFPTINQQPTPFPILSPGIYFTKTQVNDQTHFSMTFIGRKAETLTDKEVEELVETHVFDFSQNCYGEIVRVFFLDKIREYIAFNTFEELRTQLELDKEACLKLMEDLWH
jgi:riboflavin kinase / FMN adenylyltransferase